MSSSIVSLRNLSKHYKTFDRREGLRGSILDLFHRDYRIIRAVEDVSFSISPGEVVGYIGPNGAGKSTSIKMLTGILKPTSGEMDAMGFDPFLDRREYTRHIGVVFGQRTQLWWDIAVRESFNLLARIYRIPPTEYKKRLDELSGGLEIEGLLGTPVRKLSLGERMRCDLVASLLHNPRLLFLDEPTIGLDAVAKDLIRGFLKKCNREFGMTILLTTHDLNEIEELCERVIILDRGKILYDGSLRGVKNLTGLNRSISVEFTGSVPMDSLRREFGELVRLECNGEHGLIGRFDPQLISAAEVVKSLVGPYEVSDLSISEPGIEEVIRKIYRDGLARDD